MDTYPRLAKELDLAWAPDKTRIVAYNTSNGNVVATLTVKEGLFLSELDGDVDPDDVGVNAFACSLSSHPKGCSKTMKNSRCPQKN